MFVRLTENTGWVKASGSAIAIRLNVSVVFENFLLTASLAA